MIVDATGRYVSQREAPALAQVAVTLEQDGIAIHHVLQGTVRVPVPDAASTIRIVSIWRDRLPARVASPEAADLLSAVVDRPVHLVYMHDPDARPVVSAFGEPQDRVSFADGFPLLLINAASLADLNSRLAQPVTPLHFRPNVVVEGAAAWAEDDWRRFRIGAARYRVVKPCARCIITTLDPQSGSRSADGEPLTTLRRFRSRDRGRILFGQNVIPDGSGEITLGDEVQPE